MSPALLESIGVEGDRSPPTRVDDTGGAPVRDPPLATPYAVGASPPLSELNKIEINFFLAKEISFSTTAIAEGKYMPKGRHKIR